MSPDTAPTTILPMLPAIIFPLLSSLMPLTRTRDAALMVSAADMRSVRKYSFFELLSYGFDGRKKVLFQHTRRIQTGTQDLVRGLLSVLLATTDDEFFEFLNQIVRTQSLFQLFWTRLFYAL